jgi:hypothetical protein
MSLSQALEQYLDVLCHRSWPRGRWLRRRGRSCWVTIYEGRERRRVPVSMLEQDDGWEPYRFA